MAPTQAFDPAPNHWTLCGVKYRVVDFRSVSFAVRDYLPLCGYVKIILPVFTLSQYIA